jgi:hypothetical protein
VNPRTAALAIALTAALMAVGVVVWLARPPPPRAFRSVLPESLPDTPPGSAASPEATRDVTLSDGHFVPDVPPNCEPDDAGSLACRDLCASDAACPPGSLCVAHEKFGHRECQPRSRFCATVRDCEAGQACQPEGTSASGVEVRRCVPDGQREAGESCAVFGHREELCVPGLRCVLDVCGPPCDVHTPDTCPENWECAPGNHRVLGACVPSCRDRPCPPGQRCEAAFRGEVPLCHAFIGRECGEQAPCPTGQDCLRGFAEPSLETQAFECRTRCDDGQRCPGGMSCDARSGYCLHPCARDADCTAPERCHVLNPSTGQQGCGLISEGLPGRPREPPRP